MAWPLGAKLREPFVARRLHLAPKPHASCGLGEHRRCARHLASAAKHLLQLREVGVARLHATAATGSVSRAEAEA